MNDNMQLVIIMGAIALYKVKGVAEALAYLVRNAGMTIIEATDVIALYDRLEDGAKADLLY
jgi:hypothetical protein